MRSYYVAKLHQQTLAAEAFAIAVIIGGLSAYCLCFDLRWGLNVSFLEVAGTLLGAVTLAADILLIADFCKKKSASPEDGE